MRVIGIDPGLAVSGFAVIERRAGRLAPVAVGTLTTSASAPEPARLASLRSQLVALIDQHRPDVAALETLFFRRNAATAMAVGRASGALLAALGERALAVSEYTPLQVKQSVVGVGSASKRQVQAMVASLLGLDRPPTPPDAADACAVAICHLNRSRLHDAIARRAGALR